jgi:Flp pilus assembly protein TadD
MARFPKTGRPHSFQLSLLTNDTIFLQINYCYNEALKSYDMAIDINPREGMFWANKGNILMELGKTDEANAAATRARDLGYTCQS